MNTRKKKVIPKKKVAVKKKVTKKKAIKGKDRAIKKSPVAKGKSPRMDKVMSQWTEVPGPGEPTPYFAQGTKLKFLADRVDPGTAKFFGLSDGDTFVAGQTLIAVKRQGLNEVSYPAHWFEEYVE